MQTQAVVNFGEPLELRKMDLPSLKGTEVLIQTTFAGVCHSDAHMHDGWFSRGGGEKVPHPFKPPFTLGHEIEGVVVAVGPDVQPGACTIGKNYAVYPWLGCEKTDGSCVHCKHGNGSLCYKIPSARFVDGRTFYGGYASHSVVPDPKFLIDTSRAVAPGLGGVYMCSGLTAFSALKKVGEVPEGGKDILIVGLGGLGFQAVHFCRAMYGAWPLVTDIDPEKCKVAARLGCTVIPADSKPSVARTAAKTAPGKRGLYAALDFVGIDSTFKTCVEAIRPGGRVVAVGLFGASFDLRLYDLIIFQKAIIGSLTGTFDEAKEMIKFLEENHVEPPPYHFRSISDANEVLNELKAGKIMGRCVLKHDWEGGNASL